MYLITACSGQTLRIVPLGEARSRASAFDCLLCLAFPPTHPVCLCSTGVFACPTALLLASERGGAKRAHAGHDTWMRHVPSMGSAVPPCELYTYTIYTYDDPIIWKQQRRVQAPLALWTLERRPVPNRVWICMSS